MALTPTDRIFAAVISGLPTGWNYSEAAHGFFGPDMVHVEAEADRTKDGWHWTACNSDDQWKNFPATKLLEAMAWASTKP